MLDMCRGNEIRIHSIRKLGQPRNRLRHNRFIRQYVKMEKKLTDDYENEEETEIMMEEVAETVAEEEDEGWWRRR